MDYYVAILDGAGDVWGVRIPDLPGCYGGGATADDAIADATSAAQEWAEHQTSRGVAARAPRTVQEVMADRGAEFNAAAGESLVMIPVTLAEGGTPRQTQAAQESGTPSRRTPRKKSRSSQRAG